MGGGGPVFVREEGVGSDSEDDVVKTGWRVASNFSSSGESREAGGGGSGLLRSLEEPGDGAVDLLTRFVVWIVGRESRGIDVSPKATV